jgi:WhiB family redox-sensing transcriptional regulator
VVTTEFPGADRLARSIGEPRPGWWFSALCRGVDPELWFPDRGGDTRPAKEVCRGCPVRTECLEYALGNSERFGIWGGLSERERRALRQFRRAAG